MKKILITEAQYKSLINESLEEAIYYGIFLDDRSKATIRRVIGIPEGWVEYNDHITIKFRPSVDSEEGEWMRQNVGRKFPIIVRTVGQNEKALALGVECKIPYNGEHMHVTIACAEGVKPVESNNIENWEPTRSFIMYGTAGYFTKDGVKFE